MGKAQLTPTSSQLQYNCLLKYSLNKHSTHSQEKRNLMRMFQNYFTLQCDFFNDFLFHFFIDVKLRYCDVASTGSCCSSNIEQKLSLNSKVAMEKVTRDAISKMSSTLSTRAQKFNGKFFYLLILLMHIFRCRTRNIWVHKM